MKIMKKGWDTSLPYSVNEGINLEKTNWLTYVVARGFELYDFTVYPAKYFCTKVCLHQQQYSELKTTLKYWVRCLECRKPL